jgi:antitoxin component YwqK of YwqJK toxin-antitoxin module
MTIRKYKQTRNWAIYDQSGELIAVTLYKKGAQEIVRRLTATQVAA